MSHVTVIVPTFNRAHLIAASLESLLNQDAPPMEIVVVDDGSTDGTRDVLQPYAGRVTYVAKPNGGKSSAINLAMQHLRGTHVWIMDDDDIAHPSALARLLEAFAERPSLDYAFGFCTRAFFDQHNQVVRSLNRMPSTYQAELHLYRLSANNFFSLNSCLVRREAFVQAGGFDERLTRSQDYDFLLRLSRTGRFHYVNIPVFWIREHDGVRGTATEAIAYAERSAAWRKYDRILGEKLFSYSKDDWFLHPALCDASDELARRSVAIRKAYVAATKGLVERVPEFLEIAVRPGLRDPLHFEERATVLALFNDRDFIDAMSSDIHYRRVLRSLISSLPDCSPRTLMARRLYWDARLALESGHQRASVRLLLSALSQGLPWR